MPAGWHGSASTAYQLINFKTVGLNATGGIMPDISYTLMAITALDSEPIRPGIAKSNPDPKKTLDKVISSLHLAALNANALF